LQSQRSYAKPAQCPTPTNDHTADPLLHCEIDLKKRMPTNVNDDVPGTTGAPALGEPQTDLREYEAVGYESAYPLLIDSQVAWPTQRARRSAQGLFETVPAAQFDSRQT
jgi:hypothetical protein